MNSKVGNLPNIKAVIYGTSILTLSIIIIFLIIGIVFYGVYSHFEDSLGLYFTLRYLTAVAILLPVFIILILIFRENIITDIIDGFIAVLITWLLVPLVTTFIYMHSINLDFVDAFFESLSGCSGTGLTILNPERYPYIILMMRATTQWLGEVGIVVVSGVLLPLVHRSIRTIYVVERGQLLAPTIASTMKLLYTVYAIYTFIGMVMLLFSGMDFPDALTHSMTAIATGGMSTHSESIGFWFNRANYSILLTTSIIMVIGALNFIDTYSLLRGRLKEFVRSLEVRGFFLLMSLFILLIILYSVITGSYDKIVIWIYHTISGYTTTGFQLSDIHSESELIKIILICAMIIGGATFSTAGGIKTRRILIVLKSIVWEFQRPFKLRGAIIVRKLGREEIDDETIFSALSFSITYLFIMLLLGGMLHISLSISGIHKYTFIDSLFEIVSALSCVGLSTGITSQTLPAVSKIILMIAMYMGRLEFLPIYIIIGWRYQKGLTLH